MRAKRGVLAALAVAASTAAGLLASAGDAQAQATPPSVVLIVTDDQRYDTLWAIDAVDRHLQDKGVTFTRAFVPNSVCCPSRTSILTGNYSHTTGVWWNAPPYGGFSVFDDSVTIATALHAAGYRTGLFGKYLNGYNGTYLPPGWDRWFAFSQAESGLYYDYTLNDNGILTNFDSDPEDYSTDVLAAEAVRFVRNVPLEEPLFAVFTPFAPHGPSTPAPRHVGDFGWYDPEFDPAVNESDVSDKPPYIRKQGKIDRGKLVGQWRRSLESLQAVDEAVAELIRALDETGRLGSTMIVFTSDNGLALGEHRWLGKVVPYEESIRVPMVIRYDPLTSQGRSEALVANVDLAPTFADLAGVRLETDGESLLPALSGARGFRHALVLEHPDIMLSGYCGVRTAHAKYVRYADGFQELYRLERDPRELRNDLGPSPLRTRLRRLAMDLCYPVPPGFSW
jgi:N-acetylglucosamine-6-sulfatase